MNSRSRFIVACALMILAMSLAARILLENEPEPTQAAPRIVAHGPGTRLPVSRGYPATQNPQTHARPNGQRSDLDDANQNVIKRNSPSIQLTVRSDPKPDDAGNVGSHSPVARASRVEAYANAKLAELDQRLQLRSDQKRRIFALLASSSPDFDPSMLIGGIPGHQIARPQSPTSNGANARVPSPTSEVAIAQSQSATTGAGEVGTADRSPDLSSAIMNELDAGQQAIYEELLIDDLEWWSDIIAQIEEDFMNANPDDTLIDDPDAGENLFDLLGR